MLTNGLSFDTPSFEISSEISSSPAYNQPEQVTQQTTGGAKETKKAVRKTKAKPKEDSPLSDDLDEDKKKATSERRAEQNRQAQKSFRERKVKYVKDLEERLQIATETSLQADMLKLENTELRSLIVSLQNENKKLRESALLVNNSRNNFVPQLKPEHLNFETQQSHQHQHQHQQVDQYGVPLFSQDGQQQQQQYQPYQQDFYQQQQQQQQQLSFATTERGTYETFGYNYMANLGIPSLNGFQSNPPQSSQDFSTLVGPCDSLTLDPEAFLQSDPSLPISADDWSGLLTEESNKRNVEEASLYLNTPLPTLPFIFSKDEDAAKSNVIHEEMDLSSLLKKVQCKDRNPELCQGTKFMKSF